MRDYYEILAVERSADGDTIKKAYRKLALQFHPDRNGGDKEAEEKFKEATEAYEVLRDADKRAAYDRYGHAGVKGRAGGGQQQQYGGFGFEDALNIFMRDFGGFGGLEDLFGGGARGGAGAQQRGKDLQIKLEISLAEVAAGVKKTVKIRALDPCTTCTGTGSEDPAGPVTCPGCQGAGQVRRVQRSVFGQFVSASVCPQCQGTGQIIKNPCRKCSGDGRERGERTVEVAIPAGVSTNNYLTLRAQGNAGPRNGPRGDVIAVIEVEDDARFERDDTDLIFDLPLSFSAAALGHEVEIPTVYGEERIRIPAGTQSGETVRLRGKGLPQLGGGPRGDQLVRIHVWTPTELSAEQEELFRRLAELEGPVPGGKGKRSGLWSRVKDAFAA
ncbi:MAG: Chaperone protein DnaJ [uncultured Gemmatimonadetes bacterium]|uniref:Chaperone protein DnaJ n=1 Tax=uncultured Gemmatimonadota bacterium TaxID=203437 RepID=A0A6J4MPF6_9BACT|nr:MAG: Chaperone protein DnaJ [uncultured Gemmatimonadota bacterium]